MQNLTRRHMVVIEDYDHMKIIDENAKWMKLTYLLSIFFSLNLRAPLLYIYLYFINFNSLFKCTHQRENNTSPLCILRTLVP